MATIVTISTMAIDINIVLFEKLVMDCFIIFVFVRGRVNMIKRSNADNSKFFFFSSFFIWCYGGCIYK